MAQKSHNPDHEIGYLRYYNKTTKRIDVEAGDQDALKI